MIRIIARGDSCFCHTLSTDISGEIEQLSPLELALRVIPQLISIHSYTAQLSLDRA